MTHKAGLRTSPGRGEAEQPRPGKNTMTTAVKIEKVQGGTLTEASREWATRPRDQRFQSLDALRDHVGQRRMRSRSQNVDLTDLRVEPVNGDDLGIFADDQRLTPSNWSFGQFCQSVGAPAAYLRGLPAELAARNLNHGLRATADDANRRSANKLLTLDPVEDPDAPLSMPLADPVLQAVTSQSYGRIWDADCVALVDRLVERSNGAFYPPLAYRTDERGFGGLMRGNDGKLITETAGLYASDHDVFMYLIDGGSRLEVGKHAKGHDHQLNRGFFCWNSETGASTFGLQTFLFDETCGNNYVYGATDVNRMTVRHSKNGPYRFDSEAWPVLKGYLEKETAADVAQIMAAKQTLLPTEDADLFGLLKKHAITRSEYSNAKKYALREEGDCKTVWQLFSGLTASARDLDWIDARNNLERRAGRLMSDVEAPSAPVTVAIDGLRN